MNDFINHSFFTANEPVNQKVVFGNKSRNNIAKLARGLGNRVLLVTDKGLTSAGHPQEIKFLLEKDGFYVTLFDGSKENPTESSVQECVDLAKASKIDLIIGLGGGSSMDTAKGCNFVLTNGGRMSDFWGIGKATQQMHPFIAIPTTAGTGSECQSFALISHDESHKKMACGDPKALPSVTILDPELTLSQPFSVTACTGIDALSHALESAVTKSRNVFSERHASKAFQLISLHLPTVFENPDDLASRGKVLLGASHAGAAIEHSMLGAAHSIANPLTARKGLVHGIAVGLALPKIIKFNAHQTEARKIYADLSKKNEIADKNCSDETAVELLINCIEKLIHRAGFPLSLSELKFTQEDIPSLALDASEQWTARFNPRPLTLDDFENIYSSLFSSIPC